MTRLTRLLAAIALALWAPLAAAQTLSMSVEEARVLAQAAALQGRPDLAREVAAGLLRENRQDRTALIVLAAVEPVLGRPAQGRMAGVRAWRLSQTREQRYEAARLTAAAANREGRQTLAQIWLRRAAANAPSDADLDQTARDFGQVRRQNPWNLQLSFDAAPSSNVNGGSSATLFTVDGRVVTFLGAALTIPSDVQALSGWTYSADARAALRLSASNTHRTTISFRIYGRSVILSDEARALAPDAENSDYSASYAAATLSHDRIAPAGSWGVDATLGGSWSAGDLSYSFARLGAERRWRQEQSDWALSGSVEGRWQEDGSPEATLYRLTAGGSRTASAGQFSYAATLEHVDAPGVNDRSTAVRLTAGLAFAEPLGPAEIALGAGLEARHYPDYVTVVPVAGGREDLRAWATISAGFTEWSYAGFAPVLTLQASQTDSNISNFENSELSLGFSFRSTF